MEQIANIWIAKYYFFKLLFFISSRHYDVLSTQKVFCSNWLNPVFIVTQIFSNIFTWGVASYSETNIDHVTTMLWSILCPYYKVFIIIIILLQQY